jgi:hypothetical protein
MSHAPLPPAPAGDHVPPGERERLHYRRERLAARHAEALALLAQPIDAKRRAALETDARRIADDVALIDARLRGAS